MICFRPMCDIRCKGWSVSPPSGSGPCSRVFHKACIKSKGRRVRNWKCPLCSKKEIEVPVLPSSYPQKFSKTLKFAKEDCVDRHEIPGTGFNELILLDTAVPHKKREVLTSKVCAFSHSHAECQVRRMRQEVPQPARPLHPLRDALPSRLPPDQQHSRLHALRHVRRPRRLTRRCPNHYQSPASPAPSPLDSSSDYMHKSLQEQFDVPPLLSSPAETQGHRASLRSRVALPARTRSWSRARLRRVARRSRRQAPVVPLVPPESQTAHHRVGPHAGLHEGGAGAVPALRPTATLPRLHRPRAAARPLVLRVRRLGQARVLLRRDRGGVTRGVSPRRRGAARRRRGC